MPSFKRLASGFPPLSWSICSWMDMSAWRTVRTRPLARSTTPRCTWSLRQTAGPCSISLLRIPTSLRRTKPRLPSVSPMCCSEKRHKKYRPKPGRCDPRKQIFDPSDPKRQAAPFQIMSKSQKSPGIRSEYRVILWSVAPKKIFYFLCYRRLFLLHKPGVKRMTLGLFHFCPKSAIIQSAKGRQLMMTMWYSPSRTGRKSRYRE